MDCRCGEPLATFGPQRPSGYHAGLPGSDTTYDRNAQFAQNDCNIVWQREDGKATWTVKGGPEELCSNHSTVVPRSAIGGPRGCENFALGDRAWKDAQSIAETTFGSAYEAAREAMSLEAHE